MPVEGCPDGGWSTEPGDAADMFHGLIGRLQQFAGAVDASVGQLGHRRGVGLFPDRRMSVRRDIRARFGENVAAEVTGEVFEHPVA